ncbi:CTLH/CRA C-terminal to lish motif domain-containing protein [Kalaharituber pfeilii]|nr:CTLH/CRA C-terminal to lish motif domain-containing protein [Kalaharituber pfeilii]
MAMQTTKLNAESHLLLDQPLLRLPHELLRKTFKTSQKHIERDSAFLISSIKEATATFQQAKNDDNDSTTTEDQAVAPLATLDSMINRMQGLKRKLESLHSEEKVVLEQSKKRISHLQDLYSIPSLVDEEYDRWSRIRLDRLLVDALLRNGYGESAKMLAKEKGIEDLVDVDVFVQCAKIEASLRRGSTTECLAWCQEHKNALKKNKSNLEFNLRLQQYIELVRAGNKKDAITYSKKFLAVHHEAHLPEIEKAAALLAYPPDTQWQPYKNLYSPNRWEYLATFFVNTHHDLYNLPFRPLLHIALSAGLSCLKTPACHSSITSSSFNSFSSTASLCPICSTELNDLARNVPYAHHVRSVVEPDPVVLPNGRIYGRARLQELSSKLGLPPDRVRDPMTGDEFDESKVKKVYIS